MLKLIFASFSLLICSSAMAKTFSFHCQVKVNLKTVVETSFTLKDKQKNKFFGEYEGFEFYLGHIGNGVIELQSYNGNEPSRTYATSIVNGEGSFVTLSVWRRDYLLDARCTLK